MITQKPFKRAFSLRLMIIYDEIFNSFMTETHYHKETSPLICRANQWADFYLIGASAMKELNLLANTNFAYCFLQKIVCGLAEDLYVKLLHKI